jgi:hypothetical protein
MTQPVADQIARVLAIMANLMAQVQINPEYGPYVAQRLKDLVDQCEWEAAHPGEELPRKNPRRIPLNVRKRAREAEKKAKKGED